MNTRIQFLSCPRLIAHDDGDGIEFLVYSTPEDATRMYRPQSAQKVELWDRESLEDLRAMIDRLLARP